MIAPRPDAPGRARGLGYALAAAGLLVAPADADAQRYLVHTYEEEEGLPSSSVHSVVQGADGRIWAATRSGFASYDGLRWRKHEVPGTEAQERLLLSAGPDGSVLGATRRPPFTLHRLVEDRFVEEEPPPVSGGTVVALHAGVGHDSAGIALATAEGLIAVRRHGAWSLHEVGGEPLALAAEGERIHAATSIGLRTVDLSGEGPAIVTDGPVGLPPGPVHGVRFDAGAEMLWVVGTDWIGRSSRYGVRVDALDLDLGFASGFAGAVLQPDGTGGLFFANPSRLLHFHPGTGLRELGRASGIITEGATSLCRDREGNLWIGSPRGISKLVSRRFATYTREQGLFADEVSAILRCRNGDIVLGHPGGITFWARDMRTLRLSDLPVTGRVNDLAEGPDGTIWAAVYGMGVAEIHPPDEVTFHGGAAGLPQPVSTVHVDAAGTVRAGAGGLYELQDDRFVPVPLGGREAPDAFVRRILDGEGGAVLIATHGRGLLELRDGRIRTIGEAEGNHASVYTAIARPDGGWWAGTLAGLCRVEDGRLVPETTPRIDRPVYLTVAGRGGTTWFGTDNGVRHWDGKRQRRFTVGDGLAGRETNRAAGILDPAGAVWIGTNRGLSIYRPALDLPRPHPPTVELRTLDVNGTLHALGAPIRLSQAENTLLFSFRSIAFVDEKRTRFRTRLEGFDDGWSDPQPLPQRTVRYTNVPPGTYQLHVQALDAEGRMSAPATSAEIEIRRSLAGSPLVRAGAVVVGLLALVTPLLYLAQRRYARDLERVVGERTSELRRTERELAKNRRLEALGVLAGGIAHDFNNLLQVMLGGASLLEADERVPATRRRLASEVKLAGKRARSLTEQLLTFSRGGSPVRRPARIGDSVREAMSLALAGSNVRGETDIPDDLALVEMDEGQMSQMLQNLLINARQAMPEGGTVRVRCRNLGGRRGAAGDGRQVLVEVGDEGPGIGAADLDRIFDPFYSTKPGGTGLGLAVAHSIVQRHEGTLAVESGPGQGATFRILLPASTAAEEERPAAENVPRAGSGRVLVMDDDPPVRRALRAMLTSLGYETTETADGDEAIARYRTALRRGRPFDAVILDLTVPGGVGGREAIRGLSAIDPDVCAVVVTGYSNDPVIEDPREIGFRASLGKPFAADDLARVLEAAIAAGPR